MDVLGSLKVAANASVAGSAVGNPQPSNHGLVAWTFDPISTPSTTTAANGRLYLAAVYPAAAASVTKLWWIQNTAGATATSGQNWVGLYDSNGNVLASVGVDSQVTVQGLCSGTISSTNLSAGAMYWVGMFFNATTGPQIAKASGPQLSGLTVNQAASSYRFACNSATQSGLTTSMPSITPSNNTLTNAFPLWAAIS